MVHEDERKMDALTKRSTELTMVNNNAKLLAEILDHHDQKSCGGEEKQLLYELFQSCEKMQPKLFRLAADTEDDDETSLAKILQASDDINKVIDRSVSQSMDFLRYGQKGTQSTVRTVAMNHELAMYVL